MQYVNTLKINALAALVMTSLWRHYYVMTSKEYLTSSHILMKYFEFFFLQ